MIIDDIEAVPVDIPRMSSTVIRSSYKPVSSARYVIVRVRTDEGLEGYGEASPEVEWTGEDLRSCHSCITHHLAPALKGLDPVYVQQAHDRMNSAIVQNRHAKAAVEMVRAVREAVGDDVPVGVDANMGWTPIQAFSVLPALEELRVAFIEQPFSRWPRERRRDFSGKTSIPVVAHESCFTVEDARVLLATRAVDIWAVTPGTHGGYIPTRDILSLARAGDIPCLLGSTLELGIGSAFMAHIGLSATPIDGMVASDIIGSFYHEVDVITEHLVFAEGGIPPPPGPGLGVTLNTDALTDYRVTL